MLVSFETARGIKLVVGRVTESVQGGTGGFTDPTWVEVTLVTQCTARELFVSGMSSLRKRIYANQMKNNSQGKKYYKRNK